MSLYAYSGLNSAFHRDVNRFFNSPLFRNASNVKAECEVKEARWSPVVDIKETDENFLLIAEIPGVDPASVEVVTEKNELAIKGEKKVSNTDEGKWVRRELANGKFERKFALPENVDSAVITAKINHGILEVTVPKVKEAEAKKITVEY